MRSKLDTVSATEWNPPTADRSVIGVPWLEMPSSMFCA
jgi:hypothetical protein